MIHFATDNMMGDYSSWCILLVILCTLHRQRLVFAKWRYEDDIEGAGRHESAISDVVNCAFKNDLCNWEQDTNDDFDWKRQTRETPTGGTGPTHDHTTGFGYYMYTEATSTNPGAKARLMSPSIASGAYCLQFAYSMYGTSMGVLKLYTKTAHEMNMVWMKSGNLGSGWKGDSVVINEPSAFKLVFEGIRGSDYTSDMAIDDVSITQGKCLINEQFNCTFDFFTCGWSDLGADIKWTRHSRGTPTPPTGPYRDHTSRTGAYMYIEGSGQKHGAKAKLLSPEVSPGGDKCLQFFYHMYGAHIGNLTVLLNKTEKIWFRNGSHSNGWERGQVTINETSSPFTVVFQAVRGRDIRSDIAIDDVFILDGQCDANATVEFDCTFEVGICGWEQDFRNDFDCTRIEADRGFGVDHTIGTAYGHYLLSDRSSGYSTCRLISPEVPPGSKCLKFAYLMTSDNIGKLSVLVETRQNISSTLWSNNANRGIFWRVTYVNITEMLPFRVVFDSSRGNSTITSEIGMDDIAGLLPSGIGIDDVTLLDDACPEAFNSFNCTFDGDEEECGWTHEDTSDHFDWVLHKGSTFSSSNGPLADHSGNGSYIYIEVSSKTPGMKAHIVSPEVTATGPMCLEFFYHMSGQHINSLNVYTRTKQNQTFPIWQLSGNQGYLWKRGSVPISGFPTFQVVFEGVAGSGHDGDIAIDDVSITEKQCRTTPASFNCTFDANMCGWTGSNEWERVVSNVSANAFRNDTNGYDYALATAHECALRTEFLTSPTVVLKGPHQCIRFSYHLADNKTLLRIHLNTSGSLIRGHWVKSYRYNRQGDFWTSAAVQVNSIAKYEVLFEAICLLSRINEHGIGVTGFFMIDDVTIVNDVCIKPPPVFNCTFETGICGWEQDGTDNFDWNRNKGRTPSSHTGPDNDHTHGTKDILAGYYMYIEASATSINSKARLITPEVPKGPKCLQFFYHMRGEDIGSLNVYVYTNKTGRNRVPAWTRHGNLGFGWRLAQVTLNGSEAFKVVFEGVRGSEYAGDIAIDDVTITNATQCPPVMKTLNCTFDKNECGWTRSSADDFCWILNHGRTSTFGTGPSSDHTTGNGLYMFIEDSSMHSGAKAAQLISPDVVTAGQGACLQLFYHMYMYGKHLGALNIYTRSAQNMTSSSLWTRQNNKGTWRNGYVTLNQTSPFKVIIEGVRGDNESQSYIAVDDVTISNGTCLETSKTFNCTFDEDECGWQQTDVIDDFDWTLHTGATPSSSTGPSIDRTPGEEDGNYMYIEASSANTGDKAHLASASVNGSGTMCLQFYYHMWGGDIGTLNVYTHSLPGSRHNTSIWSLSGKQENNWKRANAEVNAPSGSTFKVTFEGIRGTGYAGDISIDDITLSDKPCPPGLVTASPVQPTTKPVQWTPTRSRTFTATMPPDRPMGCQQARGLNGSIGFLSSNPFVHVLSCSWTIVVESNSAIELHVRWETVDNVKCAYRTLSVYEKDMTEIGTICGNETTWDIRSKDNALHITYKQNIPRSLAANGFKASWTAVSRDKIVRDSEPQSSDWIPRVVGVTLFLVLVIITSMVVIAFLYKRKYACFSRKSDDPQLIDLADIKEDGSVFGDGSYSRLKGTE